MFNLTKQYFVMYPLRYINMDELLITDLTQQKNLLLATVQHPLSIHYPPSVSYRKYFLKSLISQIEKKCDEVLDDLYTEYTTLLSKEDSGLCFKSYFLPNDTVITLQESTNLISDGTTGLNTWQAALFLAEWVSEKRDLFGDKHVLELGSGLGLTGITVCRQCHPSRFTFSDCHIGVLSLLKQNIARNISTATCSNTEPHSPSLNTANSDLDEAYEESQKRKQPEAKIGDSSFSSEDCHMKKLNEAEPWCEKIIDNVCIFTNVDCSQTEVWQLNWEIARDSTILRLSSDVDVILAADVVYDESIIPPLVRILSIILHGGNKREAYVASTIRNKKTRDSFIGALELASVSWEVLSTSAKMIFYYDRSVPVEMIKLTADDKGH